MKSFVGEMAGLQSARMEWRRVSAWRMRCSVGGARLAPEPRCPLWTRCGAGSPATRYSSWLCLGFVFPVWFHEGKKSTCSFKCCPFTSQVCFFPGIVAQEYYSGLVLQAIRSSFSPANNDFVKMPRPSIATPLRPTSSLGVHQAKSTSLVLG